MFILSPKSNFLGGSLVSASHLGKLFPRLLVWERESDYLDNNGVSYNVVKNYWGYVNNRVAANINCKGFEDALHSIWCNDTCVDGGYYDEYETDNLRLWEFLGNFETIYLVNHQPVNRYKSYLIKMINYLYSKKVKHINLLNYRACWNLEWDNELGILFPDVKVYTLPYHYFHFSEVKPWTECKDINPVIIGRHSKCKIGSKFDQLKLEFPELDCIGPDPKVNNKSFMEFHLAPYNVILSGYYYGGEGNREYDVRYNHLEWSFMDTLFSGKLPVTSSLFTEELNRLGIYSPTISYDFIDLCDRSKLMWYVSNLTTELFSQWQSKLQSEIDHGIEVISKIINYGF